MTDTRRLQRALFRMQADAAFACAVLAEDPAALASTGLAPQDLALLEGLDPAALSADPGGRRRTQIAGNAASEYALSLARAAQGPRTRDLLDAFLSSPELHATMADTAHHGRLPLAFGAFALRRAEEAADPPLAALARLESELAHLRRAAPAERPPLAPGELVLAPRARLLELPAGTHDLATLLRSALDADRPAPTAPPDLGRDGARETLLLRACPAPSPHRLADVEVELLAPPADLALRRAERPWPRPERARFARDHGAEPEGLEAFLAAWLAEGALIQGPRGISA